MNELANELTEMDEMMEAIDLHADSDGIYRDPKTKIWWRRGEFGMPVTVTQPNDPARALLLDGHTSTTDAPASKKCYICNDPEFSRMGLPLCRKCPACGGHIAADDAVCDVCGLDDSAFYQVESEADLEFCFSTGYPDYEQKTPTDVELGKAVNAWLLHKEEK